MSKGDIRNIRDAGTATARPVPCRTGAVHGGRVSPEAAVADQGAFEVGLRALSRLCVAVLPQDVDAHEAGRDEIMRSEHLTSSPRSADVSHHAVFGRPEVPGPSREVCRLHPSPEVPA